MNYKYSEVTTIKGLKQTTVDIHFQAEPPKSAKVRNEWLPCFKTPNTHFCMAYRTYFLTYRVFNRSSHLLYIKQSEMKRWTGVTMLKKLRALHCLIAIYYLVHTLTDIIDQHVLTDIYNIIWTLKTCNNCQTLFFTYLSK